MNHTPEPWVVVKDDAAISFDVIGTTGNDGAGNRWWFCQDQSNQNNFHEGNAPADAKRIVACVNALAGIENPEEWVAKAKAAQSVHHDLIMLVMRLARKLSVSQPGNALVASSLDYLEKNGLVGLSTRADQTGGQDG